MGTQAQQVSGILTGCAEVFACDSSVCLVGTTPSISAFVFAYPAFWTHSVWLRTMNLGLLAAACFQPGNCAVPALS